MRQGCKFSHLIPCDQWHSSSSKAVPPKWSMLFPSSTTNWRPSIQIHEPMGGIFPHSNHHRGHERISRTCCPQCLHLEWTQNAHGSYVCYQVILLLLLLSFKCVHSQFLKCLLVSETEATHFFLFPLASSLDGLSTWVLYPVLEVKIPGVYDFSLATVVGSSMLFPSVFLVIWAGSTSFKIHDEHIPQNYG